MAVDKIFADEITDLDISAEKFSLIAYQMIMRLFNGTSHYHIRFRRGNYFIAVFDFYILHHRN